MITYNVDPILTLHKRLRECIFSIEAAKLVAAYGVVLIHLAPASPEALRITDVFCLFPVYYFLVAAVHFTVKRALKFDIWLVERF